MLRDTLCAFAEGESAYGGNRKGVPRLDERVSLCWRLRIYLLRLREKRF